MKRLWLCVGIIVCAITVAGVAAETSAEVEDQKERLEVLGGNIRLDFKAISFRMVMATWRIWFSKLRVVDLSPVRKVNDYGRA